MEDPINPMPAHNDDQLAANLQEGYRRLRAEVGKFIVGQDDVVEQVVIAIMAGGHCLLEGVPGLAKTMLVRTLSDALELSFRRIQFTPDLMPADITGTEIIQQDPETGHRELTFQKGPLFAQMILADEINRTPPKSQAALLEAMQEHSVTVGQHTYQLEEPFFVLATQNPIEQEGTYPLPEAQKDRFIFQINVEYPSREEEREILKRTTGGAADPISRVLTGPELIAAQQLVRRVPVPDHVTDLILDLVRTTRRDESDVPQVTKDLIEWGAGPRACQYLTLAGKVRALLRGAPAVGSEDVVVLAHPVLRHRIVPTFSAESEGITADRIIDHLLKEVGAGQQTAAAL